MTYSAARVGEVLGLPHVFALRISERFGLGRIEPRPGGGRGQRRWTSAELAAVVAYLELVPPGSTEVGMDYYAGDRGSGGSRGDLVASVIVAALDHPDAAYIVASPHWATPADSAEEVVRLYRERGDCTVVPLGAALERFHADYAAVAA